MRVLLCLLLFAASAFPQAIQNVVLPAVPATPIPIIIDTDPGTDIDDNWTLAYTIALHKLGYIRIIAAVTETRVETAPAYVESMFLQAGLTIPIGAYQGNAAGQETVDNYTAQTVAAMGLVTKTLRSQYPDAVTVLRTALASAANGSVVYCGIAPTTNAAALLQSPADGISPLTGQQLAVAKIVRMSSTWGDYPSGSEFDMRVDTPASQYVFTHNSTIPIYAFPLRIPINLTSTVLFPILSASSGAYIATTYYGQNVWPANPGWQSQTWLDILNGAFTGFYPAYTTSANGTTVVASDGSNTWSTATQSNHYYYIQTGTDVQIRNTVQYLMAFPNVPAAVSGESSVMTGTVSITGSVVLK